MFYFSVSGGTILAVGGWDSTITWHPNTEIFDLNSNTWEKRDPYPFATSLRRAPILTIEDLFYIIGGFAPGSSVEVGVQDAPIATFDGSVWSSLGLLNSPRSSHNAIWLENRLIVVGGQGDLMTESCTIANNLTTCTDIAPILIQYRKYPELFIVDSNFCQNP